MRTQRFEGGARPAGQTAATGSAPLASDVPPARVGVGPDSAEFVAASPPRAGAGGTAAALLRMQQVDRALSRPDLVSASLYRGASLRYVDPDAGVRAFDCFTNELGLHRTAARSGVEGGAVVGVSGGVLDIAAVTRAELVVSTDANPAIADAMYLFVALLRELSTKAESEGWSDARYTAEVQRLLKPVPEDRQSAGRELLALLRPAGLEKVLRGDLPSLVEAVQLRSRESLGGLKPPQLWFEGPDAEAQVAHLRRLAEEGRILAVTTTLEAPGLAEGISNLCQERGTQVHVVNLSNAFEYMSNVEEVFGSLGQLPLADDARLFTVGGHVVSGSSGGRSPRRAPRSRQSWGGCWRAPHFLPRSGWDQTGRAPRWSGSSTRPRPARRGSSRA